MFFIGYQKKINNYLLFAISLMHLLLLCALDCKCKKKGTEKMENIEEKNELWTLFDLDTDSTIAFSSDDAMILSTNDYDGYTDHEDQEYATLQAILSDMVAYEKAHPAF